MIELNNSLSTYTAKLKYVPYTGANANVDLGSQNFLTTGTLGAGVITGTSLNLTADTNQIVLNSDGGVAAITLTGTAATSAKTITFPNLTGTLLLTTAGTPTVYMPLCGPTANPGAVQSVATGTQYYPLCYNTSSSLPTFRLLPVAGGGSGRASSTAYQLICGGTSSTAAQQSIASIPAGGFTSDFLLKYGGSAALPVWTDPVVGSGTVQTTNATQTTCATIALPNGYIGIVEVLVIGANANSDQGAGYKIYGLYSCNTGTATLIGSITKVFEQESDAAWDATFTTSGTNVLVRVTGKASTTINWEATYSAIAQQTSVS